METKDTENFEDQSPIYDEYAWRLFLRTRITTISTAAEDDIIEEVSKIAAAHQAATDQRVAEAYERGQDLGRRRERYEISLLIESMGASELLTKIVAAIGRRGPTGNLGGDYIATLTKGERNE